MPWVQERSPSSAPTPAAATAAAAQVLTRKWPVLHASSTPAFDRGRWTFHIFGRVEKPWQCSYDEFLAFRTCRSMPTCTA